MLGITSRNLPKFLIILFIFALTATLKIISCAPVVVDDIKSHINFILSDQGYAAFGESTTSQDFPQKAQQALRMVWRNVNGAVENAVIDQVNVVPAANNSALAKIFHLASSQSSAAGLGIDLSVTQTNAGDSLNFKIVKIYNSAVGKLTQLTMRFTMPELYCEPASGLQCGHANFGITAVCITSGCDHKIKLLNGPIAEPDYDKAGAAYQFGVDLLADVSHPLEESAFLVYTALTPYRSIAFKKGLAAALLPYFPQKPEHYYATFFPNVGYADNVGLLGRLVEDAKNMGFKEFTLIDFNWLKTEGGFDPKATLANQISTIKNAGLNVRLHHLVTAFDTNNPAYADTKCSKNANGGCFITHLNKQTWDSTNPAVVKEISKTFYEHPLTAQLEGYYQDGAEAYNPNNTLPLAGYRDYLINLSKGNPNFHFQDSISDPNMYPLVKEGVISDRWQVFASQTPATWAHAYALPKMMEKLRMGIVGRMGWIPMSGSGTDDDYNIMLNTAVAIGAPITFEPTANELINGHASFASSQFDLPKRKKAISERVSVLGEFQGERELVSENAASVQVHFENGPSSVGVFGAVTADKSGNGIGGRAHGVQFSEEGAFFDGKTNGIDYTRNGCSLEGCSAPVSNEGSRIEVPPTTKLVFRNAFTQELWFKISDPYKSGAIVEKSSGFGLYYNADRKIVGGHLTLGAFGRFTANIDSNPAGSPNGLKLDDWNHIVYTYDHHGLIAQLYLNGVLQNSYKMPAGFTYIADQAPLFIGNHFSQLPAEGSFTGTMRDLKIYARALNGLEVTESYQNPNTVLSGIVAWMPLKASSTGTQHQLQLTGSGPFYLAPLSKTAIVASIQFNGLTAYSRCTLQFSTATDTLSIKVDAEGKSLFTPSTSLPPIFNGLSITKATVSNCVIDPTSIPPPQYTYDARTGLVILENITVGSEHYWVQLQDQGGYQFKVLNGHAIKPVVENNMSVYDPVTGLVTLPKVTSDGFNYQVVMQHLDNGLFGVKSSVLLPKQQKF